MKKPTLLILVLYTVSCGAQTVSAQQKERAKGYYDWWASQGIARPADNPNAKKLPLIQVKGNKFVNALGDTVLFRGLAIADPDKLEQEGPWNRNLFVKVKEMGAMIVRIPVHPVPERGRAPSKYLEFLDQAVVLCTELGMYVIIDWHSIGN